VRGGRAAMACTVPEKGPGRDLAWGRGEVVLRTLQAVLCRPRSPSRTVRPTRIGRSATVRLASVSGVSRAPARRGFPDREGSRRSPGREPGRGAWGSAAPGSRSLPELHAVGRQEPASPPSDARPLAAVTSCRNTHAHVRSLGASVALSVSLVWSHSSMSTRGMFLTGGPSLPTASRRPAPGWHGRHSATASIA